MADLATSWTEFRAVSDGVSSPPGLRADAVVWVDLYGGRIESRTVYRPTEAGAALAYTDWTPEGPEGPDVEFPDEDEHTCANCDRPGTFGRFCSDACEDASGENDDLEEP